MEHDIKDHKDWFLDYAEKKMASAHRDTAPMRLKLRHTLEVLNNARQISSAERFPARLARACVLAALYHDVARFEQYLIYGSFRDRDTRNHGLWGARLLSREKRLQGEDRETRVLVMAAVGLHNRYAVPLHLPQQVALAVHVVRDADKLDILRVMDAHLGAPGPYNPTVVLGLPDTPGPGSPKVASDIMAGKVPAYDDLSSVNDFRLLLGAWFFDLRLASSRGLFLEAGHARNLVLALPQDSFFGPVRQKLLRDFETQAPCT